MHGRKTREEIIEVCSKFGLVWLDGEYLTIYSRLKCQDKIGYLYDMALNGVLMGNTPKKFHPNNKYSLYNLRLYFKLFHPNIELLTEKYENADAKLNCRCLVCGNVWTPIYNSIKVGKGCPECANREHTGALCITSANRNKEKWMNIDAKIYVIKCSDINEVFYKIGITRQNVSDRFSNKGSLSYSYEIVLEINTNLYEAVYSEKELHYDNKNFKYEPLIKFDGHTECFSKINIDKILSIKSNIENYIVDVNNKTNFHISIDNTVVDIRWLSKEQLIALIVKLNCYKISAKELGLLDEYIISGYNVRDWIEDIKAKLDVVSRKDEERKLTEMENKLHYLLSNEKKIELELTEIEASLK